MSLATVQPNRIDISGKSKIWDYSPATLRCDTPVIGVDVANKDYVDFIGAGGYWNRTGTTLKPDNAGDDLFLEGTLGFTLGTTINEFSIDGTLAGDSDDAVPTEKAVKTYVDAQIAVENFWDRGSSYPGYDYLIPHNTGDNIWIETPGRVCIGVDPYNAGHVGFTYKNLAITESTIGVNISMASATNNKLLYGGWFAGYGSGTGQSITGVIASADSLNSSTDNAVYGLVASLGHGSACNDPTSSQVAIYASSSISGTDANMKKWAFYNATSTAAPYLEAGKMFMGGDNLKTYWGSGYDANIVFDGNDLVVTSAGHINLDPGGINVVDISTRLLVTGDISCQFITASNPTGSAGIFERSGDGTTHPLVYLNAYGADTGIGLKIRNEGTGYSFVLEDGFSERFSITKTGVFGWWSAPYGAVDTNLYRDSANVLKTDDSFSIGANLIFDSQTLSTISTGTGDNDKLVTQGYVDDAVAVENLWDRTGTLLTTHTANDSVQIDGFLGIGTTASWPFDLSHTETDNTGGTYAARIGVAVDPSTDNNGYYHYAGIFETATFNTGNTNQVKGLTGVRAWVRHREQGYVQEIRGLEGVVENRAAYSGTGVGTIFGITNSSNQLSDTCAINNIHGGWYRVNIGANGDVNTLAGVGRFILQAVTSSADVATAALLYGNYSIFGTYTGNINTGYGLYLSNLPEFTADNQIRAGIRVCAGTDGSGYANTISSAIHLAENVTGPRSGLLWYNDTNLYRDAANVLKTDSTFDSGAGRILNITEVTTATYAVLVSDHHISIQYTDTGTQTTTLPAISSSNHGQVYHLKDADYNAGTNNITVATTGSDTIDEGASQDIIGDGDCMTVVANNTTNNWEIQ